jgi:hypothetical protein
MLQGATGLSVYLTLKLLAYICWCYRGVRWLSPAADRPLRRGLALGVGRFALGWGVGASMIPFVLVTSAMGRLSLFYFTGLVAVRWLEWGIVQSFVPGNGYRTMDFLTAVNARGRTWRAIGVLLSYLPDAPFLLAYGFPQGRFLC